MSYNKTTTAQSNWIFMTNNKIIFQRSPLGYLINGVNSANFLIPPRENIHDKLEATPLEIFDAIPFRESRQLVIA